jgi:hypothetical protein
MTNSTTVSAVIGHYSEAATPVDPSRLTWAPGYPGHDGSTRIQWKVWDGHWDPRQVRPLAHLECAIVRDTVSHLVVDAPGVCHYEHITAMYDYVRDERLREHESHHPYMAWRVVSEDGVVLYDSLTHASEHHRVVHADIPLAWGSVVRELRNRGLLPRRAA